MFKKPPITLGKLTSKRTWKIILGWLLTAAVAIGVICGAVALVKSLDSDTRTVHSSWARGTLDEAGNYKESKASIYTKNAFECDGLEITLDFDAVVTYSVVFYDENGDVIEGAEIKDQTGALKAESELVPENAYYARVIVTPVDDANVTNLEIAKYARQIKISVAK